MMGMMTLVRVVKPDLFAKIEALRTEQGVGRRDAGARRHDPSPGREAGDDSRADRARPPRRGAPVALLAQTPPARTVDSPGTAAVTTSPTPVPDGPVTLAGLEQLALERHPRCRQAAAAIEPRAAAPGRPVHGPIPSSATSPRRSAAAPSIAAASTASSSSRPFRSAAGLKLSRQVFERATTEAEARAGGIRAARAHRRAGVLYHRAHVASRRVERASSSRRSPPKRSRVVSAHERRRGRSSRSARRRDRGSASAAAPVGGAQAQARVWRELGARSAIPLLTPRALADDRSERDRPELVDEAAWWRACSPTAPSWRRRAPARERAGRRWRGRKRETMPDLRLRVGPRYNRELLEPGSVAPVGWEAAFEAGVTRPDLGIGTRATSRPREPRTAASTARSRGSTLVLQARLAETLERYFTTPRARRRPIATRVLPRAEEAHRCISTGTRRWRRRIRRC